METSVYPKAARQNTYSFTKVFKFAHFEHYIYDYANSSILYFANVKLTDETFYYSIIYKIQPPKDIFGLFS